MRSSAIITAALLLLGMMNADPSVARAQDGGVQDAAAQDPPRPRRRGRRPQAQPAEPAPPPQEEEKPAHEPDEWFAITNGIVHTVSGPTLHGATVLCRNGVIHRIGPNVRVPDDAEVLDAAGYHVYPGLIATRSRGILRGSSPEDGSDMFALNVSLALAAGITITETDNTAAKLTYGTLEDMVVKRDLWVTLRYDSRNPRGKQQLRVSFDRLRQYLRDVAAHEEAKRTDPDAEAPDDRWIRGRMAEYLALLKGEATALADAETTYELLQICELVETYGFKCVVRGAYEGWIVADRLARAGIDVIIIPRTSVEPNDDLMRPTGSTIENAAVLRNHGVRVAIYPAGGAFGPGYQISLGGIGGRDLQHLALAAAFTVRGGLSNDEAVRTITLDAARVMGIDDRVGSIDVGKDADFVIADGDLLHYMTMARWTIVNGEVAYDKQEETLFSHIRPEGDRDAPPPPDYWPRRLGDDW